MQIKAPGSTLDWPISWALESGETIASSTWSIAPVEAGGITVGSATISGATTACLLSGGVFRRVYEVTNTIVTSAGRTHAQSIGFRIGTVEAV